MSVSIFAACDKHSRPDSSGIYPSRKAALKVIRQWRAEGHVKGNPHPFKCKARNHWHIGRDSRFRWRTAA